MRKRIFSLILSCVVLCVCAFGTVVGASAAKWYEPINYQELAHTVKYGTEYNRVTVQLPSFFYYMNVCDMADPYRIIETTHSDDTLHFDVQAGKEYVFRAYPAGSHGLLLENIPVGSVLSFDIVIGMYYTDTGTGAPGYYGPNVCQGSYYYDSDGQCNRSTELLIEDYTYQEPIHMEYTIEDVKDAHSFVPFVYLQNIAMSLDCEIHLKIENAKLEMDISTTYWQQWQNQQNGEKLDNINDSLNNQWNADIEAEAPEGSDIVDDLEDGEGSLRNEAQSGIDDALSFQENALEILASAATGFTVMAKLFDCFNIPFINALLIVSLALGITGLMFNLFSNVSRSVTSSIRRTAIEERREQSQLRYSRYRRR